MVKFRAVILQWPLENGIPFSKCTAIEIETLCDA